MAGKQSRVRRCGAPNRHHAYFFVAEKTNA
jgi:hypothetical protein